MAWGGVADPEVILLSSSSSEDDNDELLSVDSYPVFMNQNHNNNNNNKSKKKNQVQDQDKHEDDDEEISYLPPQPQPSSSSLNLNLVANDKRKKKKKTKSTTTDKDKELVKKLNKAAEKELKRANAERDKELKRAANELRKASKPGEAFKFITILIDPEFPHKEDLAPLLDSAEVRHCPNVAPPVLISNTFLFERESLYQAMGPDLQLHKLSKFQQEPYLLIYLQPDEIVPKIIASIPPEDYAQGRITDNDADNDGEEDIDLVTYVNSIKSSFPDKQITLILYGMENYFKQIQKAEHKEYRERVLNAGVDDNAEKKTRRRKKKALPVITRFDFQSTMIELQLKTGINYRVVNKLPELAQLLIQMTKAIADAPFKRAQAEQSAFDWYALADSTRSMKVDKDGVGLSALWLEQLQQFNNIGIDTASAIVKRYSTPLDLIQAYEKCKTQEDGQSLLQNLNVVTGFGPLMKTRKLGPELSKKLYRFFTSSDPERCLGSTLNF